MRAALSSPMAARLADAKSAGAQPIESTAPRAARSVPKASAFYGGAKRTFQGKVSHSAAVAPRALVVETVAKRDLTRTVADTKDAFIKAYAKPIPPVYNVILQEILCMQHMTTYDARYEYSPVASLGFVSVYDQLFSEYKYGDSEVIFKAYIEALEEDPAAYRSDTEKLTELATAASDVDALCELDAVKNLAAQEKLLHSRFLAIGLFRLLELAKVTEPSALEKIVAASGLTLDMVNRDLLTYKGLLSKLNASKELQADFLEREKKQEAARAAAKAAKETAEVSSSS